MKFEETTFAEDSVTSEILLEDQISRLWLRIVTYVSYDCTIKLSANSAWNNICLAVC